MPKEKYQYTSIKSVLDSAEKYHHIFGVIRKYHEQGVYIRDETYDSIKVNFSATFESILPHIKPGNVIRIHRLMTVTPSQYRCIKVSDVLLFSSFKDKDAATYKVRFEAKEPTLELGDFDRVASLEKWLASKLLEASLNSINRLSWYDLVCQVVDIKDLANHRVILIVYDGTDPGLKFNWFTPIEQWGDYPTDKLVCITAWDRHAAKARKIARGSIIAFFNLQSSEAKLQPGNYELHLRGGTHYGKMIRVIHPNSYLGLGFKSRLEELVPQAPQLTNNPKKAPLPTTIIEEVPSQSPSNSTQLENAIDLVSEPCDLSDIGSSISDQSFSPQPLESNKSPAIPAKKVKLTLDVKFPVIVDIDEPKDLLTIESYIFLDTDERCCVKAKVFNYRPVSRNIVDYIKLVCPNCPHKESPSLNSINVLRRSGSPRTTLPCLECQLNNQIHQLNAAFWVDLNLSDEKNCEISVTLTKLDLIKVLGVRVIPVLNELEEANKILDFLDYICPINPDELNSKSKSEDGPYLKWTIERHPVRERDNCSYRVLTVSRLEDD